MKKILLIASLLFLSIVFCQTEKETSKKISIEFEKNYNSDEYQEIFEMFSDEMKTALPNEQTMDFFKGLKNQAGKIQVGNLSNTKTELMLPTKQLLNEQYLH